MPPAVVALLLVAVGVPAAARALAGRPRSLGAAWLLSVAAVATAQALGEVTGARAGVLGDAQILLAAVFALAASFVVSVAEGPAKR